MLILLFTKEILLALGQEEEAADIGRRYILYLLPGMFAMTQFETVRRYLQGMEIFYLTMRIQCVTMGIHLISCYMFVFILEYDVIGASIATCITFWLNLTITTLYISFKKGAVPEESWFFFNKDTFKDWGIFLSYGIPAALMLCLEWWSYEICAVFAGMLSIEELAANVVLFNLIGIMYAIPNGISFALGTLVGNSLGEGKSERSKKYYITSLYFILALTTALVICILSCRWYVPYIYTQEKDVVELVVQTIPLFSVMLFFDNLQAVTSGTVRAIGYQQYASILALVGFWVFSVPGAYILGIIFDLRLTGIWIGIPLGYIFTSIAYNLV